jgi:hypothetical protein
MHFLLGGDLISALRHNSLAVLMIPVVAWLWIGEAARAFGRRFPARTVVSSKTTWILLAVILLFGVARNLPVYPFSLFTPPPVAGQHF